MRRINFLVVGVWFCFAVHGDSRVWTMVDGHTFEAEFVAVIGGVVSVKNAEGKVVRIPEEKLAEADREFIQLSHPPELDISFSKKSKQRSYPPPRFVREVPQSYYFSFWVKVKQISSGDYNHNLHLEYFVIGEEVDGHNYILLHREDFDFTLPQGVRTYTTAKSAPVEVMSFITFDDLKQHRGQKYGTYLVIITDSRGEIIAYESPSKWLFKIVESLREVPVKKHFDKTGTRVGPPRPKRYRY